MVMELIDGETLANRIEKGPLPLDQVLKTATQIADALDRAHRAGVTHRDIKPQNIMLTRDGVKVLDFGLAKTSSKPGPTEATLTKVLTTEGTVMGPPPVHGARTVRRQGSRRPLRNLGIRRRALRNGHRTKGVPRQELLEPGRRDPVHRSCPDGGQTPHPNVARQTRPPMFSQGS